MYVNTMARRRDLERPCIMSLALYKNGYPNTEKLWVIFNYIAPLKYLIRSSNTFNQTHFHQEIKTRLSDQAHLVCVTFACPINQLIYYL